MIAAAPERNEGQPTAEERMGHSHGRRAPWGRAMVLGGFERVQLGYLAGGRRAGRTCPHPE
jgi:hypothetical protein